MSLAKGVLKAFFLIILFLNFDLFKDFFFNFPLKTFFPSSVINFLKIIHSYSSDFQSPFV